MSAMPPAWKGDRGPKALAFIVYHKDCPHSTVVSYYMYGVIQQKYARNHIEI